MLRRRWFIVLGATALAACEHRKAAPPSESARAAPPGTHGPSAAAAVSAWDSEAGPALLVATDTPAQAIVVTPDTLADSVDLARNGSTAAATLLGRGGTVQVADIQPPPSDDPCDPWTVTSAPPPRAWNVGFVGGVVTPLPMDSVESLPRPDSAALVAAVTRLASALPNDKAGRFAGLPFEVRTAYRFKLPSGRQVVAATLLRQINQEASPLEERTLLIAERNASGPDTTYSTAYYEQSRGPEDTVESTDVLAAVLVGQAHRPTVVVSRDFGDATGYGFIERAPSGNWSSRWSSPRRSC